MNLKGDLIRLIDLDKDFIIDLKYATTDNFTKVKIYQSGECYINKNTARHLIEAKNIFKKAGYKIKIWDAYRPISAQKKFFEILPNNNFVATPPDMNLIKKFKPSHMNGLCIDLTLTDISGQEISMPSKFDDFSKNASLTCSTTDVSLRNNAEYLKSVMELVGFQAYSGEWWHFYDIITTPVPYLDFQF